LKRRPIRRRHLILQPLKPPFTAKNCVAFLITKHILLYTFLQ